MDQSQIFTDRAYVFNKKSRIEESEGFGLNLVAKIFSQLENPLKIDNCFLVEAKINYDLYKILSNNKYFCLKLSFADEDYILKREAQNLKLINNSVCPKVIENGSKKIGDILHYSVTSYENADTIDETGRGYFIDNFNNFCQYYKLLQQNEKPQNKLKDVIGNFFELNRIEKFFISEAIESLQEYSNRDMITSFFSEIESEAASIYNPMIFDKNDFCHGDLTIYNILSRGDQFKMINLDYSYRGNCMMDLSKLILSLGAKKEIKKNLIKVFCKNLDIDFNQQEYDLCERMNLLLILHQLAINYLYEVYMFESSRPLKICQIIQDYAANFDNFCKLPFFHKYKEFISKTITEPIVEISAEKV